MIPHAQETTETPSDLPVAIWQGTFTIMGVPLRCAVLDDGRRVIQAEDVQLLLEAMERGDCAPIDYDEIWRFTEWRAGR